MSKSYRSKSLSVLKKIESQYAMHFEGMNSPICLHDLFCRNGFSLREYCKSFRPHLHSRQIYQAVEKFGQQYNIWLKSAPDYITCHLYLFPNAHLYRMMPLLKNCAVDFYLNDEYGREVYHRLPARKKLEAKEITSRICDPSSLVSIPKTAFQVEYANQEMMNEIKLASPEDWFQKFLYLYNLHVEIAHANCETSLTGVIPSVQEYIDSRCDISGMKHTVLLIEYAEGQFLNWKWLEETGIANNLRRLQYLIAAIGCLSNDLFSFEKEVIKNHSDSNLVAILAHHHPEMGLKELLISSAAMVGDDIAEFLSLVEEVRNYSYQFLPAHQQNIDVLEHYLNGLERFVQASWVWQVSTQRYKSKRSIFEETTDRQAVMA